MSLEETVASKPWDGSAKVVSVESEKMVVLAISTSGKKILVCL